MTPVLRFNKAVEVSAIMETMAGSNENFVTVVRGGSWTEIWQER